ncbi:MAG: tetratricopeptide repeat protein [Longimicrobiales bacterium]
MVDSHREEIAKLEALYAANPEGRVFTHLAEAYRKAGELDRAREILEDGHQRHADYSSAHVVLGRVLGDTGRADEAASAFRRVLELDRHNLVALQSLGELAATGGRTEEALDYYRELSALDPSDEGLRVTVVRLEERRAAELAPPPVEAAVEEPVAEDAATGPAEAAPFSEPLPDEVADRTGLAMVEEPSSLEPAMLEPEMLDLEPAMWTLSEPAADEQEPEEFASFDLAWTGAEPTDEATTDSPGPLSEDWEEDVGIELEALPGDLGVLAGEPDAELEVPHGPEVADEWVVSSESLSDAGAFDFPTPEIAVPDDAPAGGPIDFDSAFDADFGDTDSGVMETPAPSFEIEGTARPSAEGELVTETMAELYFAQGFYDRAADVYRSLLRDQPADARLHDRLREAESLIPEPGAPPAESMEEAQDGWLEGVESAWTGGGGVAGAEETPYAWAEPRTVEEPSGPAVGGFFRSLLEWRPGDGAGSNGGTAAPASDAAPESPVEPADEPAYDEAGNEALEPGYEASGEAWTGSEAPQPPELPEAASAAGADEEAGEDDEDLEMFRSWLQSLKK